MAKVEVESFKSDAYIEAEIKETEAIIKSLLQMALSEKRSLDSVEQDKLEHYQNKLQNLKNQRFGNRKEEKRMTNKEFLKQLEEKRELNIEDLDKELRQVGTQYAPVADGTTQVEVPQNIMAGILMEAQRTNEIFGRCTFIATSQDTKLNVGAYQQEELAQLKEFQEINMKDFDTDHVEVVLNRYGTGTRVSKRLVASSNFDIMQHVRLLMGDRLGLTAEKLAIKALDKGVTAGKVAKVEYTDAKPLEALVKALLKLKPVDRAQAVVVCSPEFFEKAILEEDANGRNKLSYELQQIRPTVMGVPVVVSDALADGAYIGNFRRAMVACVNLNELVAKDEPSVHAVDVFLNVYMGASVQMPEAVVRLAPQA